MTPHTAGSIAKILRSYTEEQLLSVKVHDFQRWPVTHIVPGAVVKELISNERSRRRGASNG